MSKFLCVYLPILLMTAIAVFYVAALWSIDSLNGWSQPGKHTMLLATAFSFIFYYLVLYGSFLRVTKFSNAKVLLLSIGIPFGIAVSELSCTASQEAEAHIGDTPGVIVFLPGMLGGKLAELAVGAFERTIVKRFADPCEVDILALDSSLFSKRYIKHEWLTLQSSGKAILLSRIENRQNRPLAPLQFRRKMSRILPDGSLDPEFDQNHRCLDQDFAQDNTLPSTTPLSDDSILLSNDMYPFSTDQDYAVMYNRAGESHYRLQSQPPPRTGARRVNELPIQYDGESIYEVISSGSGGHYDRWQDTFLYEIPVRIKAGAGPTPRLSIADVMQMLITRLGGSATLTDVFPWPGVNPSFGLIISTDKSIDASGTTKDFRQAWLAKITPQGHIAELEELPSSINRYVGMFSDGGLVLGSAARDQNRQWPIVLFWEKQRKVLLSPVRLETTLPGGTRMLNGNDVALLRDVRAIPQMSPLSVRLLQGDRVGVAWLDKRGHGHRLVQVRSYDRHGM